MTQDLDKPHPILYINGKKLIGHYEATDGTELIITPRTLYLGSFRGRRHDRDEQQEASVQNRY